MRDVRIEAEKLFGDDAMISVTGILSLFASMISAMMLSMAKSYIIASVVITVMMIVLI